MKKTIKYLLISTALVTCGCSDLLDRESLTTMEDTNYWRSENDLRSYANHFYETFFPGYGLEWDRDWAYSYSTGFCDDFVSEGTQSYFTNKVPTSLGSKSESRSCSSEYYGPTWGFGLIRSLNIFIDRLNTVAINNIDEEAYRHWMGVAKFLKGFQYADLVSVYGDVPYFADVVKDDDPDTMYKDRDARGAVMDSVYVLFNYALDNMRDDDGALFLNKYIAAGYISRFMLNEGTWQKYHGTERGGGDAARAKKYLELAVKAGDMVINSGKWSFDSDFKSLFASFDLSSNSEVLFYRHYDASLNITHAIGSYNGGSESETGVNLAFIKAFNCNDGKPASISTIEGANDFSLANLTKTRDPRFDACFYNKPDVNSSSLIYHYKFASKEALQYFEATHNVIKPTWYSDFNENDAPLMRLGEIVLNWIEAKEELALSYGGAAVTQEDIDKSINAIRQRPLDDDAKARGVQQTAALNINAIPEDPDRDSDVPALLWEIRRERRMELFNEGARIKDLRRWHKLDYMDYDRNPDNYLGPWIDFSKEVVMPNNDTNEYLDKLVGVLTVQKKDGSRVTYDGTNASEMVGFYVVRNATNRETFRDRNYLAPIGQQQIDDYHMRGYTLSQTYGW